MKTKKLIIIDDEPDILEIYSVTLSQAGYKVFTAKNGKIGREMIEKILPDLVLLDVVMPVEDGFDVLKKMKNNPMLAKIPVILLTNLTNEEDKEEGFKLGTNDYLVKAQYSPKRLLKKIDKFFLARNLK